MVEVRDLPLRVRPLELVAQPVNLGRRHVRAIQREELDVLLAEVVIALPVHVEFLVEALRRIVVVAERGVELHAIIEQRLVRLLELVDVVDRPLAAIQVVAQHDRELERELGARLNDLRRDVVLIAIARPAVADDEELHRVRVVGQRGPGCRRLNLRCRRAGRLGARVDTRRRRRADDEEREDRGQQ